nr:alpha-galactosidase [Lachnospiraceae bacterium]
YLRQEYPSYGTGDFKSPAVEILQDNGSRIVDFKYVSYEIFKGKKAITPLPATYTEDDREAETLEITLKDSVMDTELVLSYTLFTDYPAIARHAVFTHHGEKPIHIERAMSFNLDLIDMDYEMLQLSGTWSRERYIKTRKLEMGIQAVQGLIGTGSSAEENPFIALKRPDTTEHTGEVFGLSLVYSSNFLAQAEVSTFDMTRLMIGINPQNFSWLLKTGESFTTPEAVLVYSDEGLNGMSQAYHRLYRTRLARGKWRDEPRPILLNNWEATLMDFNEEKILNIAKKAKEAGAELFVLDDGWFGARNDDYRGLGDWAVNLEKLPSGIDGLSKKIEDMGLKFGLWVELEMVNKDSDLYRTHPDWIISCPGRFESTHRHQNVLDFTRQEVVDHIYNMISKVFENARISYIKWDMNRPMSEPFGKELPAERQGEFMHRYILGTYSLYTRLIADHPEILFESCASGGARFDPGMLYFAPQAWCSDDTDAGERVKIQYGTSLVYPISSIGAHVSAVPNAQVLRKTTIATRANVAYFGTFGYELDLNLISEDEFEEVKRQIEFMKKHRRLLQIDGNFIRLLSPFEGNDAGWMVVSPDKETAIAMFYQRLNRVNGSWLRFKLAGLNPDRLYHISYELRSDGGLKEAMEKYMEVPTGTEKREFEAYGDELMNMGIVVSRDDLNRVGGDFASIVYVLE